MRRCGRICWLAVALCVHAADGFCQGLLIFNNRVGTEVVAPVYGVSPYDPARGQQGNGQVYNGAPLAGAGFTAQLFGGPTNVPPEELLPLEPATVFRTGDGSGFVAPPSRAVAVPGVVEGQRAKVQLRAWDNRGGSITNWEQALADPTVALGESLPIITPRLGSVLIAPPNLIGLESFSLVLPIRLSSLRREADGMFRFDYVNPTGVTYCIDASEDLSHWSALGSIASGNGTFVDEGAVKKARRFYRVVPCVL